MMVFSETDARYLFVRTSEEVTNALEATGVPCPAARTGDATGEDFTAVAVGHAPCILEFGDKCNTVGVRQDTVGVSTGVGGGRGGNTIRRPRDICLVGC